METPEPRSAQADVAKRRCEGPVSFTVSSADSAEGVSDKEVEPYLEDLSTEFVVAGVLGLMIRVISY